MSRWALAAVVLGAEAACLGDAGPAPDPCGAAAWEPVTAWGSTVRTAFGPDGVSGPVDLPSGYLAITLDDPTRCVQVESASRDGERIVWPRSRGLFCRDCAQRVSAAVGGGLFDLASPDGLLTVTFGLRDCATWTPTTRGPAAVTATLSRGDALRSPARLSLNVDVAVFGGPPLRADALLREASAELSDARITLRPRTFCALPAPADTLLIEGNRHDVIARWTALARARCPSLAPSASDPRATVLVVPCLRQRDPILGFSAYIDGYTTHIPGGSLDPATPDAVVVSAGCDDHPPVVDELPLGMPRVLAHELGHFLGLYHAREANGVADPFGDTPDDNLMNAMPTRANARGLTPAQAAVARRHPWLRVPRAGNERCADP